MKTNKVTRIEIINHQDEHLVDGHLEPLGRVYTKHNCQNVELQDNNKTLKLFISKKQ